MAKKTKKVKVTREMAREAVEKLMEQKRKDAKAKTCPCKRGKTRCKK